MCWGGKAPPGPPIKLGGQSPPRPSHKAGGASPPSPPRKLGGQAPPDPPTASWGGCRPPRPPRFGKYGTAVGPERPSARPTTVRRPPQKRIKKCFFIFGYTREFILGYGRIDFSIGSIGSVFCLTFSPLLLGIRYFFTHHTWSPFF